MMATRKDGDVGDDDNGYYGVGVTDSPLLWGHWLISNTWPSQGILQDCDDHDKW